MRSTAVAGVAKSILRRSPVSDQTKLAGAHRWAGVGMNSLVIRALHRCRSQPAGCPVALYESEKPATPRGAPDIYVEHFSAALDYLRSQF
ncbi:hypothetical protein H7J86_24715 [Mycobacterium hackensackense]|uniref:hypothetical protein n=1 Tax=Mycobacterium hackensackense TaxID=228909 RepID=UPI002265F778|nr:hypothetical protein [Mycobacterium hackensackense]MCV7255370.1 hypothetical protein [Mycobacterium hackensackense]